MSKRETLFTSLLQRCSEVEKIWESVVTQRLHDESMTPYDWVALVREPLMTKGVGDTYLVTREALLLSACRAILAVESLDRMNVRTSLRLSQALSLLFRGEDVEMQEAGGPWLRVSFQDGEFMREDGVALDVDGDREIMAQLVLHEWRIPE